MTPLLDICPICGRELGYCPCAPLVLLGGAVALVAVLAVWWAGVSVGEWVRGER